MRKAGAFFLWLLLMGGTVIFAQEEEAPGIEEEIPEEEIPEEEIPIESDWSGFMPSLYSNGDQTFTITLGIIFPTLFIQNGSMITHNINPVGGTGSLAYTYFLGSHVFVGGEIGIMFDATLRKNTLFIIPIGLRAGYQFLFKRFEFPVSLLIGFAPQRYLELGYFGLFVKPSASAFFRFNPDWSFGINTAWWWVPQWTPDKTKNVDGNFIDITLSARYHF
ncbi:MAG: hypothetical protein LBK02_01085 [Treponema sp.]|jgi:hypothetical protein|nr:hypothetical protein [Treponema sp.]